MNGEIASNNIKSINIEWYWDYYGNDIRDTIQGINANTYSFEICLISIREEI